MFEYLKGILTEVMSDAAVLEVQGIGYKLYMANPYRLNGQKGQEVKIWVHQSFSQEAVRLYGFYTSEEKTLFLRLISVSGIGPKSAISILSLGDHAGFVQAIEAEDIKFLTKFPGVGKKTAQQIILDLKEKLGEFTGNLSDLPREEVIVTENPVVIELRAALTNLGYSSREISRVVKQVDFTQVTDTAEAIRIALRFITSQ